MDKRFLKLLNKWIDECEALILKGDLDEDTSDLAESVLVVMGYLLLVDKSPSVIEVTKDDRGRVIDVKVGEHGQT